MVAVGGLGLLCLPALLRPLGRRLPPDEWARLITGSLALGALAVELSLLLAALPTVLRAASVPGLAAACERAVGRLTPGGPGLAWIAAVLAPLPLVEGGWAAHRVRRAVRSVRVDPAVGEHSTRGGADVVVVPLDDRLAISVPGRPPQVIVSEGMRGVLDQRQLDAVLAHESAHLEHGHQWRLVLAAAVQGGFGMVPLVVRSAACLRAALERWADEEAAAAVGREVIRSALEAVAAATAGHRDLAAFSGADSVLERIEALECAPTMGLRGSVAVYLPTTVVGIVSLASLGAWMGQAHAVIGMTPFCSM